jgi:hypothetical protein
MGKLKVVGIVSATMRAWPNVIDVDQLIVADLARVNHLVTDAAPVVLDSPECELLFEIE